MAALDTVAAYLSEARTLLQDEVVPYRYSDSSLVAALNIGILETRRLRPDLFIGNNFTVPNYSSAAPTATVDYDEQYRSALLYYVLGHAQMRDDEGGGDDRAAKFKSMFVTQLMTSKA